MAKAPNVNGLLDRVRQGQHASPLHRALYGISLVVCLLLVVGFGFAGRWQWALFGGLALIAATILWYVFDAPKGRHAEVTKWFVVGAFGIMLVLLLVKLAFVLFHERDLTT
jgi:hypothetical protein